MNTAFFLATPLAHLAAHPLLMSALRFKIGLPSPLSSSFTTALIISRRVSASGRASGLKLRHILTSDFKR